MQLSNTLALQNLKILYVSAEESLEQTTMRANRLKINNENISLLMETDFSSIKSHIDQEKPDILILDEDFISYKTKENISSLKTLYSEMSILILITNFRQKEIFTEVGIEDFISKDSAEKFYNDMVIFLNKACDKKRKS